jgi:hypothetical protein
MGMNEEGILVNSQLPYFFPNLLEMSIKKSGEYILLYKVFL